MHRFPLFLMGKLGDWFLPAPLNSLLHYFSCTSWDHICVFARWSSRFLFLPELIIIFEFGQFRQTTFPMLIFLFLLLNNLRQFKRRDTLAAHRGVCLFALWFYTAFACIWKLTPITDHFELREDTAFFFDILLFLFLLYSHNLFIWLGIVIEVILLTDDSGS